MTRVAIVGGGLGGLAAAGFLHEAGLSAVVYERARELREVGAGIMVAPNAARMLRRLDAFRQRAVQLGTGLEFRRRRPRRGTTPPSHEPRRPPWRSSDFNHLPDGLPDGPEQQARDEAFRAAYPLAVNAWIYAHDPLSPN